MWNGLRRSIGSTLGAIFGTLWSVYMIGAAYFAAIMLSMEPQDVVSFEARGAVLVLVGLVLMIAWTVGPIIFTSSNPLTNSKNFLIYAIPNRQFITGVVVAGIVGPTGIATLAVLTVGTMLWGLHLWAIIAGILAAIIGTIICVLTMYTMVGLLTNIIAKRAVRDAIQMIILIPLMLGGFIIFGAVETIQEFWDILPTISTWLAYTPVGFLALPWFVAQGAWVSAGIHLVVMLAYVVGLVVAFNAVINRVTKTAGAGRERERQAKGLGIIGRANTPMKAIWARSLLYWLKDPRYAASLVVVGVFLLFVVLDILVLDTGEFGFLTTIIPVLVAFTLAFSISADLSYDSTGFSLHVTAGVRGIDDRLGRVLALLTWALPLVVILTTVTVYTSESMDNVAAWLGLNIGILLCGTGLSAVLSARYIYPVPPPEKGVMSQPEGGTARVMLVQGVGMLVQVVIALPVIGPAVYALVTQSALWGLITLMIGVLYGAAILWVGVKLGAKWYERAQPETYQSIVKVAALY